MASAGGAVEASIGASYSLLVLGGSIYQVPFIEAARRIGCRVITADNRPDNPGHSLANTSFSCDTTDIEAIVSLSCEQRVDGVLAAATDVALDAAAAVGAKLNLYAPSVDCVKMLTRKLEFRNLQSRLGLPLPKVFEGKKVDFPCIVKPNRASGSKGVRIVNDQVEYDDALLVAGSQSVDRIAFCESYLLGAQGTVEGVFRSGRIAACMITNRITTAAPYAATVGHSTPANLSPALELELRQQIERVFTELSYENGPFDCDFMIHEGRIVLIEMAPRAGGNSLVTLLGAAANFDMPSYVVRTAIGLTQDVAPFELRPASIRILGVKTSGPVSYDMAELERLRSEPWVYSLSMDCAPGDHAQEFTEGRHRIGELSVVGDTIEERDVRLNQALSRLDIKSC